MEKFEATRELTLAEEIERLEICDVAKKRLMYKCKMLTTEIGRLNDVISSQCRRINKLENALIELSLLLGSSMEENK